MTFDDVAVVGIGETEKSRARLERGEPYHSLEEYFHRAAVLTLADAGLEKDDVDAVGVVNPQVETPHIYGSKLVETFGFEDVEWLTTVDHGGASATALLIQAAMAVESGMVDTFLCLGADAQLNPYEDDGGPGRNARGFVRNYLDPFGTQGPNARLAHVQNVHMHEYGTTREQLAEIAVAQRRHATRNPLAYFDEELTVDEYLEADPIADPIRLYDCVLPVNGGYGLLLTSTETAAELDAEPVSIRGFGQSYNHEIDPHPDMTTTGIAPAGRRAREMAGIDLESVDFFQPYDDYPIIVLMQIEDMGFCEKGAGGPFVESTDLDSDGDVPLNTSGGQLSVGQSGLSGGFVQLLEGIRQLQGAAGDRQVPGAELGAVTGVGGIAYGQNLQNAVALILEGAGA